MMKWARIWLVPGAVFQSVTIGGGYGTGREIVEYVSSSGPINGVVGCLLIALLFGVILSLTFDFARQFGAHDYRVFMKQLIGPAWVVFEGLIILALLIVLAVCGAAAGEVIKDGLGTPHYVGTAAMLAVIVALAFLGREWVQNTLTLWSVLITCLIVAYAVAVFSQNGVQIAATLSHAELEPNWWRKAAQFAAYNVVVVPTLLYSARAVETRGQAWGAGMIGGVMTALPALIYHLTFMSAYPEVLDKELPTYFIIQQLHMPFLFWVYIVLLFGAIAQTGAGILQGFNERLDNWWWERRKAKVDRRVHAAVAGGAVVLSLLLSNFGIIALVARGYSAGAWFSIALFLVPLLTVGVWKMATRPGLVKSTAA